jgi:predicted NodU family carbamoyl transferase
MVIYGMFFGTHQFSTTLIKDGKILYAIENERITRKKHGYSWFESPKASPTEIARDILFGFNHNDLSYNNYYQSTKSILSSKEIWIL